METMIGRILETLGRNSVEAGVLVLVVLLAQRLCGKRIAPRWRCALWMLVMVRLLLPVSVGSVTSLFNCFPHFEKAQSVATPPPVPSENKPMASENPLIVPALQPAPQIVNQAQSDVAWNQNHQTAPTAPWQANSKTNARQDSTISSKVSWPLTLFSVWLAGMVMLGFYVLAGSYRMNRRLAKLEPVTRASVLDLLRDCCGRLRIRNDLSLLESSEIGTPALHGFLRPKLLLPRGFVTRFSAKELRFILLHELAHVKRCDILFNWLAAVLQIVHWFNPLIWFGFSRWRADRELACDALVLETAGAEQSKDYGRTILRLLENFTQRAAVPGLVGILEDKKQLRWRIRMIAGFRPGKKFGLITAALFVGLGLAGLTDAQMPKASVNSVHTTDANNLSAQSNEVRLAANPVLDGHAGQNLQSRFQTALQAARSLTNVEVTFLDTVSWRDPATLKVLNVRKAEFSRTLLYSFLASGQKYHATIKLISGTEPGLYKGGESAFDGESYRGYDLEYRRMAKNCLNRPASDEDPFNPLMMPFGFLEPGRDGGSPYVLNFTDITAGDFPKDIALPPGQKTNGMLVITVPRSFRMPVVGPPGTLPDEVQWTNVPTICKISFDETAAGFAPKSIETILPAFGSNTVSMTRLLDYTNLGAYQFPSRVEWVSAPLPYPPTTPPTLWTTGVVTLVSARIPDQVPDSVFQLKSEEEAAEWIWDSSMGGWERSPGHPRP